MKKLIYSLSIILFTTLLWQGCENDDLPGSIYGTVVDKATGEPIKSAGVELSPGGLKTVTGSEGQFEFTQLTPGNYTLLITKTGYVDFATSTVNVLSNEIAKCDVQIEKLPPALKVVNDSRQEISELDFGSSVDDVARSFSLFNDGEESLEWQITTTAEWIKSVSKTEGVLSAGATQSLIVTLDRAKLKSGKNTTTLHISSNNGAKQLTIIATGPTLATLNTLPATNVKTTTVTLNGEILTDGSPKYSERGFVYSESSMPTFEDCIKKVTSTLTDSKKFSAIITGLTQGKTYYARAYAVNGEKEAYSTNEVSFVPTSVLAQVSTQAVTNISRTIGTATFNGTIIGEGDPSYTERGFVYATTHNPEIGTATKVVSTGKGIGEFSVNTTNLQLGNTYYVRAYAINEQGIAYGEEVSFDFNVILPEVSTSAVSNITLSTALLSGNVLKQGDPSYTECGFVYGTISNPTLTNGAIKTENKMSGIGKMEIQISGLKTATQYYVSSYAISTMEVVYGNVVNFITPIDVQGIVLNEDGEAIVNANIIFSNSNSTLTSQTDQDGKFTIKGVLDSKSYKIEVKAKGYAEYKISSSFSLTNKFITIIMQKLGSISGIVKDNVGNVLRNHPISYHGTTEDANVIITETNNEGYYEILDLVPGKYYVDAHIEGYFREGSGRYVTVLPGSNVTCNLTLQKNETSSVWKLFSFKK